jgi:hypothetical protein
MDERLRRKVAMDRDDLRRKKAIHMEIGDEHHHRRKMAIILEETEGVMDDRRHPMSIMIPGAIESGKPLRIVAIMESDDIISERIIMKRIIDEGD